MSHYIDLGHNHIASFCCWKPDRALNPQYAHLPDIDHHGITLEHLTPQGEPHVGAVTFDSVVAREVFHEQHRWKLISLEPLTLSPSIACQCGDHGFIKEGRWIPA